MLNIVSLGPIDSALSAAAGACGAKLTHAPSAEVALTLLSNPGADLVFVHTDTDLAAFFKSMKDNKLSTPLVAVGPAQPAVGAKSIRLGAIEYLTMPLDARLVTTLIQKAKKQTTPSTEGPVHGDAKTADLLAQAKQYANSPATILLRGESGTGKEVFSRYVHQNSPRKDKAFVAVNCAAIPENLLESELFGHEKGAFSGALGKRIGKFQQADGGTLLLDEISEMDLALQAKLLRAIQEKVIDPVGADKPVPVDIRLIATTNRQLEAYVAEGKFREDLYFRLNVVMLEIPPLRDRIGDILPLARYFATHYAEQNGFAAPTFEPEAEAKLSSCYWKGNVRELENTIHRAILLSGGATVLTADHIMLSPMSLQHMSLAANNSQAAAAPGPQANAFVQAAAAHYARSGTAAPAGPAPTFIPKTLADAERDILVSTLSYTQGNRQYAADLLGISVTILKQKLSALGLTE